MNELLVNVNKHKLKMWILEVKKKDKINKPNKIKINKIEKLIIAKTDYHKLAMLQDSFG